MKILFIFFLAIGMVFGGPWLDRLLEMQFSLSNPSYKNYDRAPRRQAKGGKERWKEICRVVNPDSYAFPGRAPMCPY